MFVHQKNLAAWLTFSVREHRGEANQPKKSIMKNENEPHFGLSTRAANICERGNLITRSQIFKAIDDGRLHPKSKFFRNYGWKSHIEIHRWLGLPKPKKDRPRIKVCPHCQGNLC
jgi:hypothetical protein